MNTYPKKAETLKALHHQDRLLILPNVWDAMGARLLTNLGYPAVATASAAIAFSRGYDDGQKIPLPEMLKVIRKICSSTQLPVTADFERGYAESLSELEETIKRLIDAGAAGLNIEDSLVEEGELRPEEEQVERIATIRSVAHREGVPLVINARCDAFLQNGNIPLESRVENAIARGQTYAAAGADVFYPILLEDTSYLETICREVSVPVNVLATCATPSQEELFKIGVRRLSLGPGWLKAGITCLARIARDLLDGGSGKGFTHKNLTSTEVRNLLA